MLGFVRKPETKNQGTVKSLKIRAVLWFTVGVCMMYTDIVTVYTVTDTSLQHYGVPRYITSPSRGTATKVRVLACRVMSGQEVG
jgi:hypothetical protein